MGPYRKPQVGGCDHSLVHKSPRTMPVSSKLRPTTVPILTLPVVLWVITVIRAPGSPLCVPALVRPAQSVPRHMGHCAVWLITSRPPAPTLHPTPRLPCHFRLHCRARSCSGSLCPVHLLSLIASPPTQSQPWVVSCRTFLGAVAHQGCFLPPCSLGYLIHVCNWGAQGTVNSAPRFPAPQSTDSVSLLPLLMLEAQ